MHHPSRISSATTAFLLTLTLSYASSAYAEKFGPTSNKRCSGLTASAFSLDTAAVAQTGKLSGTITYKNNCSTSYTAKDVLIYAQAPDGTHFNFWPQTGKITLAPGQHVNISASSATIPSDDFSGEWMATGSFEDMEGGWHAYNAGKVDFTLDGSGTSEPTSKPTPTSAPISSPTPTSTPTPTSPTTAPVPVPTPVGPAAGEAAWSLVFDDEFTETSLDTSKWSTGWFGSGITVGANSAENNCYDPKQLTFENGMLDVTIIAKAESCGGKTQPYATGAITTNGKFSYTYGYAEARYYVPAASNGTIANWPAFWADGQNWPEDGEDDIVEGLSGSSCYHFISSSGNPGGCGSSTPGWHTYASDWEPGVVTYYYDGVKVGSITEGITSSPMYLIVDNVTGSFGGPLTVPATMQVDYVRVWQKK